MNVIEINSLTPLNISDVAENEHSFTDFFHYVRLYLFVVHAELQKIMITISV